MIYTRVLSKRGHDVRVLMDRLRTGLYNLYNPEIVMKDVKENREKV